MNHVLKLQSHAVELPDYATQFVQNLLISLNMHDVATFEHCSRVAEMSALLASDLKLNSLDQSIAMYSGLLHDIGKLKVPTEIINKPGKLTNEEYATMKKHADYGAELMAPLAEALPFFKKVSEAILYHHERVDGKGYHGLEASRIPYASKIILVVDTVDAMVEDRPYRKGCTLERAIDELIVCSGTQFDPTIASRYVDRLSQQLKKSAA